jgi:hypothetical protein
MVEMAEKANGSSGMPARRAAVLIGVVLASAVVGAAPAQQAFVDVLPGLVVEEADLPVDAAGQPQLDAVPGARARQPLAADVDRRVRELSQRRAPIGAAAPRGAAAARIGPLPDDGNAPPRMDSGDRDPDHLRSAAPPPRNR